MDIIFKQKLKIALIINFLILILEIVGLFLSIERHGVKVFVFYTENSNYFALIVSLIFCIVGIIALKKQTALPHWVHVLRFIANVGLVITFIVSVFIIIPLYPELLTYMLFQGSSLYQHLLCPLLSLFSFMFFECQSVLPKKVVIYSVLPTLVYGLTMVILNLFKAIEGPYPFFYFYQIPWYISTFSILGILVISFATTIVLLFLNNKKYYATTQKTKHYVIQ